VAADLMKLGRLRRAATLTFWRLRSLTLRRCYDCERYRFDPDSDCGKADHPHCPTCGHCQYRHHTRWVG
jgi:hypothetical protein